MSSQVYRGLEGVSMGRSGHPVLIPTCIPTPRPVWLSGVSMVGGSGIGGIWVVFPGLYRAHFGRSVIYTVYILYISLQLSIRGIYSIPNRHTHSPGLRGPQWVGIESCYGHLSQPDYRYPYPLRIPRTSAGRHHVRCRAITAISNSTPPISTGVPRSQESRSRTSSSRPHSTIT